jgi:hypothetical protein
LKHILNDLADHLAVEHNTAHRPAGSTPPVASPLSEVEILHGNAIITSHLDQVIKEAGHSDALRNTILKQTGWAPGIMNNVDFVAHKQAFFTKLIHGLYQMRKKDSQYYGTTATCSCCQLADESLIHVFSCTADETVNH